MMTAWLLNILGLVFSTVGGFLLIYLPMGTQIFRFDLEQSSSGKHAIKPAFQVNNAREIFWIRIALYLSVGGFVLQLVGTLIAFINRFWI